MQHQPQQPRQMQVQQQPQTNGLPAKLAANFVLDPLKPQLGQGAFATVLQVADRSTGKRYACKVMERQFYDCRAIGHLVDRELRALKTCAETGCRNVVRIFDSAEESGRMFLLMELCHSNLYDYTRSLPGGRLAEAEAAGWMSQLLCGLSDLHGCGILHRDIKPTNLLRTDSGVLKITDFGWCAFASDAPTDVAGTFHYMAPEIMERRRPQVQTPAVDAWSAAATMLELLLGRTLLSSMPAAGRDGPDFTGLLAELASKCPPPLQMKPADLSADCWELFQSLLTPNIAHRRTVAAALRHSWLDAAAAEQQEEQSMKAPGAQRPRGIAPQLQSLPTPVRMRSAARDISQNFMKTGSANLGPQVVRMVSTSSSVATAAPSSSFVESRCATPGPATPCAPMPAMFTSVSLPPRAPLKTSLQPSPVAMGRQLLQTAVTPMVIRGPAQTFAFAPACR